MNRGQRGFTLAELLIVVAVIAALVAVSIPIFTNQVERSRESADFSSVRTAYAEVMYAANTNDGSATFNGEPIRRNDGTFQAVVSPLKQKKDGWTTQVENMAIGSVPASEWDNEPRADGSCTVIYDPGKAKASIVWGNVYSSMTLNQLYTVDNQKRIKEDQKTLKSLGEAILKLGMTKQQLRERYSILEKGGGIRIANYYQLKNNAEDYESAGFRITSKAGSNLLDLLKEAGYVPGDTLSETSGAGKTDTVYEKGLFFSNELATIHFNNYDINATMRSIILEKINTDSKGVITGFDIYTKAMDNQANLNEKEKAMFRFTIK